MPEMQKKQLGLPEKYFQINLLKIAFEIENASNLKSSEALFFLSI